MLKRSGHGLPHETLGGHLSVVVEKERALVQRQSLSDQTVRAIRDHVLTGRYQLGQKLREAELGAEFQVSHSVIREALHVLQGEGIVVTKPYCGRSVFSMTPAQARELVVMRASLESYAAYLAAEKLTAGSSESIAAAAEQMGATACRNYSDWVEREMAFHNTVWRASGNDLLVRQLNQVVVPSYALPILDLLDLDFNVRELKAIRETTAAWELTDSVRGHQRLARAILSGDSHSARNSMVMHIMGAPSFQDLREKLFGF